jgi:hypothetical protein
MGRPSKYTEAMAAEFCKRLADGRTVRSICSDEDMPVAQTIYSWLNAHPTFLEQYARAKEIHADAIADECFQIADTADADTAFDEYGNPKPNHEYIQRSKLRIDTRKWYLSKVLPKKYGDKIEQTIQGGEKPVVVQHDLTNATHAEVMDFIRQKTQGEK